MKGQEDGKIATAEGHRQLHFAVPCRRAGDSEESTGNDPPRCAGSKGDNQLLDASFQAARHSGLLRWVAKAHRAVPAYLRRQGPGESNRSLRWTEGQPPVSSR